MINPVSAPVHNGDHTPSTGLVLATTIWVMLLLLSLPLLLHPYLLHGLKHLVHFYSLVWTAAFAVLALLLVAAFPITLRWRRTLRR